MRFLKHMYIGESLTRQAPQYIEDMKRGKFNGNIYLITLASNPADMLEFVPCRLLYQRALRERLPLVIGLASSTAEASEMVPQIMQDASNADPSIRVRVYLESLEIIET